MVCFFSEDMSINCVIATNSIIYYSISILCLALEYRWRFWAEGAVLIIWRDINRCAQLRVTPRCGLDAECSHAYVYFTLQRNTWWGFCCESWSRDILFLYYNKYCLGMHRNSWQGSEETVSRQEHIISQPYCVWTHHTQPPTHHINNQKLFASAWYIFL